MARPPNPVCVASQLIDFDPEFYDLCHCSNSTSWDCCIAISYKWCASRNKFPAYFSYLLGHEFGHAFICLSDISLHIHCCLIRRCIKLASKHKITLPHELPNEQLFDQFGKYLSRELHGQEKLYDEIQQLKTTANDIERKNLTQIEDLNPSRNFNELRKTMIDFSMPYKDELIECWKHVDTEAKRLGDKSLTSLISDYDKLFEY